MKYKRLFDFSAGYLAIFIISYTMLFAISLYNLISGEHKVGSAIAFGFFLATFIVVIVRFGILTVKVGEDEIVDRKFVIKKSGALFLSKYDLRFREPVIVIRDRNIEYVGMNRKEIAKNSITVQATKRNCAILSSFFGVAISAAEKPKRVSKKKK